MEQHATSKHANVCATLNIVLQEKTNNQVMILHVGSNAIAKANVFSQGIGRARRPQVPPIDAEANALIVRTCHAKNRTLTALNNPMGASFVSIQVSIFSHAA